MAPEAALFETVPKKDILNLYNKGKTDWKKVPELLGFQRKDVAEATGLAESSIRFDKKCRTIWR